MRFPVRRAMLVILLLAQAPLWSQTPAWHSGIAKVTTTPDLNRRPGTAFVVALRAGSAYLVTGAHVVEGDSNPRTEFVADPDRPYQATVRHLEAGEERGLALLVVPSPPEGVLTLLEAGPPAPAIGTRVHVAGFPASEGGRFFVLDTTIGSREGRDLVLSRETGEGFSGGPVVREGGVGVVGLVFGREGFGRAVGSASLREYLEGHNLSWTRGEEITAKVTKPAESKPEPKPALLAGQVRTNPADGLSYVWIPPGEFQMGCSPGDSECDADEKPLHTVRIARGFWLGQTEVTQAAYEKIIGENPSHFKGTQHPVEQVSWGAASKYCKAVSGRLPTEAEWEYAARAGSTGALYGTLDVIAWHAGNSSKRTQPVKQKQPNAWGLHDMLGNVWEWVSDWYGAEYYQTLASPAVDPKGPPSGTSRVARGGSWDDSPRSVRASVRGGVGPEGRGDNIGFRCVREVIP